MAIIKCKMCGGDMELSPDKTFGTCEYCGSVMTLPKVDDDQRAAQFNRGNHFRRQGEFDKALAVYERIVAEDDTDAEAHWCCALCRFGIEYVEDPATYEYIPTCHRASFDSFLEDVDYLAAVEHSDGITKRQYQKDGAKIAEVQRAILATSQKEEPFDVFICYKETDDETKERTRDSLDAQEIYYNLTQEGYRVFFARITLEDKAGAEYEPYIFAALNSAKVMVVVGEKAEYFSAVWVKNEWSRFLSLMRKDRTKLLLPCYKNVDPYDLPEQLGVLQSYDMAKIGFMQDLIRGIKKVLAKDGPKEAVKETVVVQQSPVGANITAQLKRGMQALEDKDWAAADGFFDKALDMDAECAEAFFGKALAEEKCSSAEELIQKRLSFPVKTAEVKTACERDSERVERAIKEYTIPGYLDEKTIRSYYAYDERSYDSLTKAWQNRLKDEETYWSTSRTLSRAVCFAKDPLAAKLKEIRSKINESLKGKLAESESLDQQAAQQTRERYAQRINKAEAALVKEYAEKSKARKAEYNRVCQMQKSAKTVNDYEEAARLFESVRLHGYEDCDERAEQCREEAEKIVAADTKAAATKKKKKTIIGIIAAAMAIVAVAAVLLTFFAIIPGNKFKAAEELLFAGDYDSAATEFADLRGYKNSAELVNEAYYQKATAQLVLKDFDNAAAGFAALGEYRDSAIMVSESYYQKAKSFLSAGYFEEAQALFTSLGNYKNSVDEIDAIIETYYSKAQDMFTDGNLYEASRYFYKCGDYKDAREFCQKLFNWQSIAVGLNHVVGLKSDGSLVAIGDNAEGQCDISSWRDIVAVGAGFWHTVGLQSNGSVVAVGSNFYFSQMDVKSWKDIVAISAGPVSTIGLKSDGSVVATGSYTSDNISSWRDIAAIAAGHFHTVGLVSDGTVVADGDNEYGQCDVNSWTDIAAIATGYYHTIGLKPDGTAIAVGNNEYDQCNLDNWTDIKGVAAGGYHTVGLKPDGTVVAVGNNEYGQCNVSNWKNIVGIACGAWQTVGLMSNGTVVAVGNNEYGQLRVSPWINIKTVD